MLIWNWLNFIKLINFLRFSKSDRVYQIWVLPCKSTGQSFQYKKSTVDEELIIQKSSWKLTTESVIRLIWYSQVSKYNNPFHSVLQWNPAESQSPTQAMDALHTHLSNLQAKKIATWCIDCEQYASTNMSGKASGGTPTASGGYNYC